MRSLLSALLCVALFSARAQAPDSRASIRLLVRSSSLAGYRFGEAQRVWSLLKVGDTLELVREPGNAHDPNAVRVDWRGHKLGYVPRSDNGALAWAIDRGDALRAHVSRLTDHPNPRRRIEFEVFIE